MKKDEILNGIFTEMKWLLAVALAISIVAYVPSFNHYIDIISQFKYQYFLFGAFSLVYFSLCRRHKVFIALSILLMAVNFLDIKDVYLGQKDKGAGSFKLLLSNVHTSNTNYGKVLDLVYEKEPDIVVLEEVDSIWLENIAVLKKEYPYFVEYSSDWDNFGIALYSKIPTKNLRVEQWTANGVPTIVGDILINNKKVKIVAVHTLPPISGNYIKTRNEMLQMLNKMGQNGNIVIAGDLNTTAYSRAYKKFINKKNLKQASSGYGHTATWYSAWLPFMRVEIDHVLMGKNVFANSYKVEKTIGSDHLPVIVELGVK